MALFAVLSLAAFAAGGLGRALGAESAAKRCPPGGVRFEGIVTFEDSARPLQLSKEALLTIDVSEEEAAAAAPKAALYVHDVPLHEYSADKELSYGFCAAVGAAKAKLSLKARVVDQADAQGKVEYIGETVVTAGSDSYEADLTLAKVEQASGGGEPSVADCHFGSMPDDVVGIAVKAFVHTGAQAPLPKPTYLAVTLHDLASDLDEPDVISLFAGDVSGTFEPGKPVPAFLCAKVPAPDEPVTYALEASLHLGWDGFETRDAQDRTHRKGDLLAKKPTPVVVVPRQTDYSVQVDVTAYEPPKP